MGGRFRTGTAGAGSESQEQKALFIWWRTASRQWPDALMFAIPNGGARNRMTGARLKQEGVMAGVPDVFLAWPACGFHGLFVEMKKASGGRLSQAQKDAIARLRRAGYAAAVCEGFQAARKTIEGYMEGTFVQNGEEEPSEERLEPEGQEEA